MGLVLNEEQRLLQDTAKEFLASTAPIAELRKIRDEGIANQHSTELWQQMTEMGWSSITIPEAYGGLEFGYTGLGTIFEKIGRNLTASPLFSSAVMAASIIELGGSEEQKQALLPLIASGELVATVAIDDGPRHNPLGTLACLSANGDGFTLNGEKAFVAEAGYADKLIVLCRSAGGAGDAEGLSAVVVDANAVGVNAKPISVFDSRNYANVQFDNVAVEATAVIGDVGAAWAFVEPALDRGRIIAACELMGVASESFDRTVEYLKDREQFGRKIGTFQALQHRASHMYAQLELLKSVLLDALGAIDEQRADLALAASHAKALASDTATLVVNEAVQMHGGIGVTDELDIGLLFKRARVLRDLLGTGRYHQDRFATLNGY